MSSRLASMSSFSANGSPTWTLGRLAPAALAERGAGEHGRAADAVTAGGRAEQHREVARARRGGARQVVAPRRTPTAITLTSGLLVRSSGGTTSSPPTVGTPTQLP